MRQKGQYLYYSLLTGRAVGSLIMSAAAAAALGGVTHLDVNDCGYVDDFLLDILPASLRVLSVRRCDKLTPEANFTHLTALTSLDCSQTRAVNDGADGLPPSLLELDISDAIELAAGVSLAPLSQLRVLRATASALDDDSLASLPASLLELHLGRCDGLTPAASFAHLTALRILDVAECAISDASLASMPPSLVSLHAPECKSLTPAGALPHLPALQMVDVSGTDVGDALVASLLPSLVELRLAGCRHVSARASLDHLRALRALHCIGSQLAPTVLAGCCARGCAVPATDVKALALLADGRLASGNDGGGVQVWDVAVGEGAAAAVALTTNKGAVRALAALPDGRRLAVGVVVRVGEGGVEVWNVGRVPPVCGATIDCRSGVWALAVLPGGRLVAGCASGKVRVLDGDAGTVAATLEGHSEKVTALAVLSDGALLASGSWDKTVRVWDVGARACVATLAGHSGEVWSLAVLPDGRLASSARDATVRLWDVATRACVGVLGGHPHVTMTLAALPDGRLVSGSEDGIVRVWDTRPAAAAASARAAGAVPVVEWARFVLTAWGFWGLAPLHDGRLACAGSTAGGTVQLLDLPPPAPYE